MNSPTFAWNLEYRPRNQGLYGLIELPLIFLKCPACGFPKSKQKYAKVNSLSVTSTYVGVSS